MIKSITKNDLCKCLNIIHKGYETVAIEFGITDENAPDRAGASLPYEKLLSEFESDVLMFAYYSNDIPVGFLSMKVLDGSACSITNIVVLPEHRHNGYGVELLEYCKQKARELCLHKITFGMINDNNRLRRWYEDNGFVNIGYKHYDGAPFTVGKMECIL